jgi:hypothetical protein
MKFLHLLIVFTIFFLSCSRKTVEPLNTSVSSRSSEPLIINCDQIDYSGCEHLVWCYHDKVSVFSNMPSSANLGNYKVSQIVNCFVEVSNSKAELQELANSTLIQYYGAALERGKMRNPPMVLGGGIHRYNPYYRAFSEWNSKESFEIGLKHLEYKAIDCWDFDICDNLRWNFVNYVLRPKLTDSSNKYTYSYYKVLEAKGLDEDFDNVDKLEKFVDAYCKLLIQDWNDGKLKLKVEEEQESER